MIYLTPLFFLFTWKLLQNNSGGLALKLPTQIIPIFYLHDSTESFTGVWEANSILSRVCVKTFVVSLSQTLPSCLEQALRTVTHREIALLSSVWAGLLIALRQNCKPHPKHSRSPHYKGHHASGCSKQIAHSSTTLLVISFCTGRIQLLKNAFKA